MKKLKKSNEQNKKNNLTQNWLVCLLAVFCCLLWGSAFPFVKIGYRMFQIEGNDTASQILFAGCRFFLAGILAILSGSIINRKFLFPAVKNFPKVAVLSCFQTIIQYLFFYLGMAKASGVTSSIINGSGTFFAVLIATLITKRESMTRKKLLGCVLGLGGVILISVTGSTLGKESLNFSWNGEGFIIIASLCYGISSVLIKEFGSYENPVTLSGYQFLFGGLVMMILAILLGGSFRIDNFPGALLMFYMAFISAAAYSLWGILLKYNPVSKVAIYGFAIPVFGVILSVMLLGEFEKINLYYLISLALVSTGIYLVNKKDRQA